MPLAALSASWDFKREVNVATMLITNTLSVCFSSNLCLRTVKLQFWNIWRSLTQLF